MKVCSSASHIEPSTRLACLPAGILILECPRLALCKNLPTSNFEDQTFSSRSPRASLTTFLIRAQMTFQSKESLEFSWSATEIDLKCILHACLVLKALAVLFSSPCLQVGGGGPSPVSVTSWVCRTDLSAVPPHEPASPTRTKSSVNAA